MLDTRNVFVASWLLPLSLCLAASIASAEPVGGLDTSGGNKEAPAERSSAQKDENGNSDAQESGQKTVMANANDEGGNSAGNAAQEKKEKDADADKGVWSSDIPWSIAALIAIAGGFTAFQTAVGGLFTVRSTHGAVRGFPVFQEVKRETTGGANGLSFRIVNDGGKPIRGVRVVGWVRGPTDERHRIDGPEVIDWIDKGSRKTINCVVGTKLRLFNRIAWVFFRKGRAGVVILYTDHADVVHRETRTFLGTSNLTLLRWRSRKAYYSIG